MTPGACKSTLDKQGAKLTRPKVRVQEAKGKYSRGVCENSVRYGSANRLDIT